MCHGMGPTASAAGERITLVWSLSEPQWGLDLTSLSRLFGATAAIMLLWLLTLTIYSLETSWAAPRQVMIATDIGCGS